MKVMLEDKLSPYVRSTNFCAPFAAACIFSYKSSSPNRYIKALGLTYLRFTLPPAQLWEWFEPMLDDDTELTLDKKKTKKSYVSTVFTLAK